MADLGANGASGNLTAGVALTRSTARGALAVLGAALTLVALQGDRAVAGASTQGNPASVAAHENSRVESSLVGTPGAAALAFVWGGGILGGATLGNPVGLLARQNAASMLSLSIASRRGQLSARASVIASTPTSYAGIMAAPTLARGPLYSLADVRARVGDQSVFGSLMTGTPRQGTAFSDALLLLGFDVGETLTELFLLDFDVLDKEPGSLDPLQLQWDVLDSMSELLLHFEVVDPELEDAYSGADSDLQRPVSAVI